MVYKSFKLNIIIRIILLLFSNIVLGYLVNKEVFQVSTVILGVLIIYQTISLIRYNDRSNKKLTQFLASIRHSDFTSSFSDKGKGKTFEELNSAFNEVISVFNKTRSKQEEQYNYMQTIIQHINIGILAYRSDGKADIFNTATKRIFNINNLKNINDLKSINHELPAVLLKMKSGENILFKLFIDDELLQLSIYATEFKMRGENYILVSLQNIHTELEEKEIESWQKLIRVLTHEIMNSITPISSLASTVKDLFVTDDNIPLEKNEITEEIIENAHLALETIEKRSQGLLNFVNTYRNLTRIPKPNFRYIQIQEIFNRVEQLLYPKVEKFQINFEAKVYPEDLKITADPDLIEQVVINLILNAIDAVKEVETPKIAINALVSTNGKTVIYFRDNGYGIKPDIVDKIFMPFFTSKKEGSGIGLSLSRQIMHLHKGKITVKSNTGEGTVFTLVF